MKLLNTHFKQTCILYFTTGANSSKSFSNQKNKNTAIQKALFKKTLKEIRQTQLNYVVTDGKAKGNDFESRIKSAVEEVFLKGYQNIVIVGDDTPQLSAQNLLFAAKKIADKEVIIGESEDGGAYLIAFNKQQFYQGILENLPWQTNQFYQSLLCNIKSGSLSHQTLPVLQDLDDSLAVHLFINKFTSLKFAQLLKHIYIHQKFAVFISTLIDEKPICYIKDRAPPLAA
ncbi:DUF2064 domain-containing protein [Pedobacter cryophilus]|uniref:DUF2064 domain-containing protein n=1 Tax=Pedobacter cryophilus TaxID=2571271 RepID=UPI00145ECF6A|nr:DUF2064 domain-containing protein [Pedobacter cryophilus]